VGAIVGGVVGGIAVIGAAVFGIVFLLLRRRKRDNNAQNAAQQQPMLPGQPQMMQPQYQQQPYAAPMQMGDNRQSYYHNPPPDQKMAMHTPSEIASPTSPAPTYHTHMTSPMEQQGQFNPSPHPQPPVQQHFELPSGNQ
jgi:hypothetical protein